MKKLFLAIIFSVVLFIGLPYFNVSAMSVTYDIPFSYVPDIADLYLGMLAGGQYDLSDVSSLEEVAEKHKASLKQGYHFLQNFATKLWNWQVTQAGLGNTSLTEDTDLSIYVTPSDIAAYMGYNLKWWERDKVVSDIIIVEPPTGTSQSILNSIDVINGTGFDFIRHLSVSPVNAYYNGSLLIYSNPISSYSSYTYYHYNKNNTNSNWTKSMFTDITTGLFISQYGIDNIYITSNNGVYTCILNKTNSDTEIFNGEGFWYDSEPHFGVNMSYGTITKYFGNFNISQNAIYYGNSNPFYNSNFVWSSITISGTLNEVFEKLSFLVRNANIYVDGVLFTQGGVPDVPSDYVSAPDVIQVGDTGIESYDVFIPDIPGYGGLSINGFLEWLNTHLGDKDIGLDDLIEDAPDIVIGVDENEQPTIRPITYDDTRPAPIVIDGVIPADPDPDYPTPTPDPESTTFPLPPLPKFPLPSDIPNANIQHTVLAEIVEATDSVVPQDLMILIWSTFSLMIIGGIIYILHK